MLSKARIHGQRRLTPARLAREQVWRPSAFVRARPGFSRAYSAAPVPSSKKAPWWEDGLSFKCTGCGKCCTGPSGFVWLSEADVKTMAARLGETEKNFYLNYTRYVPQYQRYTLLERPHRPTASAPTNQPTEVKSEEFKPDPTASAVESSPEDAAELHFPTQTEEEEFECIFLEGTKCSIYDARPVQCRTFPYWPSVLQSRRSWTSTQNRCEGIDHPGAPLVSPKVISEQMNSYNKEIKVWESHKRKNFSVRSAH